jgi:hypothetical protein
MRKTIIFFMILIPRKCLNALILVIMEYQKNPMERHEFCLKRFKITKLNERLRDVPD